MSPALLSAISLSARVALVATLLDAAVGLPLAYALARKPMVAKSVVEILVTLPLVLPPTVTGYYLIVLLGRRGWLGAPLFGLTGWSVAFTWYGAAIAAAVMALPLLVRTARAAIESVDRDLERAAFTLGRSEWQTALAVTIPLAIYTAVETGETGDALLLAGALTVLSCLVILIANRLGAVER